MTTTYDGSSGSGTDDPYAGLPPAPSTPEPPTARDFTPPGAYSPSAPATHAGQNNGGSDGSALALLRERMAARPNDASEWRREIPGVGLRIVCNPEIENATFRGWMKASQPKGKRRGGQPADPADADQLVLAVKALAETCVAIELDHAHGTGRDADWRPLTSEVDQEPLTLKSDELKRFWNVLTELALLQKWWAPKADPRIIDAGMALLAEAGYTGELDDDPEA